MSITWATPCFLLPNCKIFPQPFISSHFCFFFQSRDRQNYQACNFIKALLYFHGTRWCLLDHFDSLRKSLVSKVASKIGSSNKNLQKQSHFPIIFHWPCTGMMQYQNVKWRLGLFLDAMLRHFPAITRYIPIILMIGPVCLRWRFCRKYRHTLH